MKSLLALLICILPATVVFAQDIPPAEVIYVGIINGRAVKLPKPEYPEAARKKID